MGIKDDTFVVISDWIFAATGMRPYMLDSNFIAPAGQYIGCKLMSPEPASWSAHRASVTKDNDDGRTEVYQHYLLTYHITGIREGSIDTMFDLAHSLREPEMQWILNNGGLGYSSHSTPTDRSVNIDSVNIEERSAFNVYVYYTYSRPAVRGEAPGVIIGITPVLNSTS